MDIKQYIASGIIEVYVMGLCTKDEESELEVLRQEYPELNEAITRYEEEIERNMRQQITLPPPETDEIILKKLDSLNIPVVSISAARQPESKYILQKIAAVAAIVLLVISIAFNYLLFNKTRKQELALKEIKASSSAALPLRDYTIMKDPTITPVAMYGVGIHSICRCTMFWDKKTGKLYIMIHHLPLSSSSKDYQLWAMVDGKPVSVGIIQDEIRGRFIEMQNVPPGSIAFTVTLEKAGGSDIPTEEETYLKGQI
ncbi:MAG TPA: anti-sigma factor [Chitinophagaceae bacterium]|nr:anti-sigma factor [Chitinophagaceae bacterium]